MIRVRSKEETEPRRETKDEDEESSTSTSEPSLGGFDRVRRHLEQYDVILPCASQSGEESEGEDASGEEGDEIISATGWPGDSPVLRAADMPRLVKRVEPRPVEAEEEECDEDTKARHEKKSELHKNAFSDLVEFSYLL